MNATAMGICGTRIARQEPGPNAQPKSRSYGVTNDGHRIKTRE
ncbi:hypothetical protein [Kocuria coralli]|nr:hypothetical protein [Kocuria coralli]